MLYDVELDLNESSKGREQTFKQILLQLSLIEGYKGDLWALFRVSICCPAVLKVFVIQMVSIDPTGHILAQYSDFFWIKWAFSRVTAPLFLLLKSLGPKYNFSGYTAV